jgi:hypothetical protein
LRIGFDETKFADGIGSDCELPAGIETHGQDISAYRYLPYDTPIVWVNDRNDFIGARHQQPGIL